MTGYGIYPCCLQQKATQHVFSSFEQHWCGTAAQKGEQGTKTTSALVKKSLSHACPPSQSGSDERRDMLPTSKREVGKVTGASLSLDYRTQVVVW